MRPDDRRRPTVYSASPPGPSTHQCAGASHHGTGWSAGEPMACRYGGASCDSELHWVLFGAADSETACMTGVVDL